VPKIWYSELTEVEKIAAGGFGVVYRAKHAAWETVAYKELAALFISARSQFVHYSFTVVCSLQFVVV